MAKEGVVAYLESTAKHGEVIVDDTDNLAMLSLENVGSPQPYTKGGGADSAQEWF
ncbi:hypothetical protein J7M28_12360 [bacterium]|nr:hypothetical protein [bacterium]